MHQPLNLPAIAAPQAVDFTGVRRDFRKLVTRGAWLELLTLGFYRFWLSTDMRRHLWSHTEAGGDHAEYTGTGKELLIGFLVALAVLVPLYLGYFFIGLEAERWQAFASIPFFGFFYLFAQFAIYRARRYRLTRTVWRGVRLWMGGSGWAYAWRAALWGLWSAVTLGLALPWANAALERFKMRHTHYGALQGEFVATGGALFRKAWWLWLLALATGGFLITLPFIYAVYKAFEWRWWISGLRMGSVRFESDLDAATLMGLYWKVVGWLVLLLVLLSIWFGGIIGLGMATLGGTGSTEQQMAGVMSHPAILVLLGFGYVLMALAFNVVFRMYLVHDLWAKVAQTTVVHNLAAAHDVVGQGEMVSALGEGFADGLDVGGF